MAFVKTPLGQQAFKDRSALFSARQRATFIMVDGVKSAQQILTATAGLGMTPADIEQMVENGFIQDDAASAFSSTVVAVSAKAPVTDLAAVQQAVAAQISPAPGDVAVLSKQQKFALAWPQATKLTASMGLRGFRLNLAVEASRGFDDLLLLFPKIQAAVGAEKCAELERTLKT